MMRAAAAIAPMTRPLFSTCPAAPVEAGPDEVGPVCVLVTVSVAVRMGPVALRTVVPVEFTTGPEPETEAGTEVEVELDWVSLVVLTGIVEPPAIVRAFGVS